MIVRRTLPPLKISINIDLTSYLPEPIPKEIKQNPKKAAPTYFIPDYKFESSKSFRDLVEKVKSEAPTVKIIKNPALAILNRNFNLVEKVENLDAKLNKYYALEKLKQNYTIKIKRK